MKLNYRSRMKKVRRIRDHDTRNWVACVWRFVHKYWNSGVAIVSVVGYLILSLIPTEYPRWKSACLFLGANGVIWTLIELKLKAKTDPKPTWYRSMRSARKDILDAMRAAISKSRRRPLSIYVIGGRIRTVSDMLEEVFEEIIQGTLYAVNVNFLVCCINPDSMRTWIIDTLKDHTAFRERVRQHAEDVRVHVEELTRFNREYIFQRNQIEVAVVKYDRFPTFYAFVIGKSDIFWGYYTWNSDSEDFDGPVNPCFRVDKSMEVFKLYWEWFVNRAQFFQVVKPAAVSLRVDIELDSTADSSAALNHALDTNRQAYDSLASFYARTGGSRAKKMHRWLKPLYENLEKRFKKPISLLELGPGDGSLAAALDKRGYRVTAIEFSSRMCEHVRKNASTIDLIEEEFFRFKFGKRRFHCIVGVAFVHLFPSPWDLSVLQKIKGLLKDGGIAYLATTIHEFADEGYSPKSEPKGQPIRYRRRYKREHFERLLVQAGFEIIESYVNEDGSVGGKRWMNFIVKREKDKD